MNEQIFDNSALSYEVEMNELLGSAKQDVRYFAERKAEIIKNIITEVRPDLKHPQIVEVGCGIGMICDYLSKHFDNMIGLDVSEKSLEIARKNNPKVHYQKTEETSLPLPSASADVLLCIGVFHHVPPAQRNEFVQELNRVMKPGGLCFVFEHNPFHLITQWIVSRCSFDKDASLLSRSHLKTLCRKGSFRPIDEGSLFFTPLKALSNLEWKLKALPMGTQYYTVFEKP